MTEVLKTFGLSRQLIKKIMPTFPSEKDNLI